MNRTDIEWVRSPDGSPGYTWNPISGCLNHDNGLCKGGTFPCYAYKLANGRLKPLYLANKNTSNPAMAIQYADDLPPISSYDPFYPRFWEERLYEPVNKIRRWGKQSQVVHRQEPKGIFVCDMSDLFGIGVPEEWTRKVLDRFQYCPQHRFYLLTKQPQNLIKFSPFPDNAWVGVTATNQEMLIDALAALHRIKATIKYISFEPLLEAMNGGECGGKRLDGLAEDIDWLIIGACTGTNKEMTRLARGSPNSSLLTEMPYGNKWTAQPRIEWVREIVEAADKAGVKVFLKDNLKPLFGGTVTIDDKWVWAEDLGY